MLIEELPALLRLLGTSEMEIGGSVLGDGLKAPLTLPISSSAIASATYTVEDGALTVTFRNGRTYTYEGVPISEVMSFVSSGSQGAHYDENIKGTYKATRRAKGRY